MTRRRALGVLSGALVVGAGCLGADGPVPGQPQAPTGPTLPADSGAPRGDLSGMVGTYYGQTSVELVAHNRRQSASDDVIVRITLSSEGETNPFHLYIKSPIRGASEANGILPGHFSILSAAETFRNHDLTPDINRPPPATVFRQFWTLQSDGQRFSGVHDRPWDNIYNNAIWYETITSYGTFNQVESFNSTATLSGAVEGDIVTATIEGTGEWVEAFRIAIRATRSQL